MNRSSAITSGDVPLEQPRLRWIAPATVFLITFAVFTRALSCDFVYDDWTIIVNNTHLNPPTWPALGYYWNHITYNLYQPMACMTWALVAHLAFIPNADPNGNHLNPAVFHLINILIHAAAATALYRLLFQITASRWSSVAGALLFGIHPIQVEAATFIGVVNNPLAGVFSFLALSDYLKAIKAPSPHSRATYFRGMFFFILAFLSKPPAIVIPPIAFCLDLAFRGNPRAAMRSILPYALLALPCAVWTKIFQTGAIVQHMAPIWFRPVIALDTIAFYVLKFFLPLRFSEDYGRTPALLFAHPWMTAQGFITVALIVAAWFVRRRAPLVSAAIFAFIIALLPTSGLAPFEHQQYSTVADRYAYLAMLAPSLLVALALSKFSARHRLVATAICALIVLILSLKTIHEIGYWKNDRTLFGHTVEVNPASSMGFVNLAYGLLPGDPAASINASQSALRLIPGSAGPHLMIADADIAQGDRAGAIQELRRSIAINPNEVNTHRLFANLLDESGDAAGAISEYDQCLRLDPGDASVHTNLAALLAERGDLPLAIRHYHQALAINSHFETAVQGLAMAELQLRNKTDFRASTQPGDGKSN